MYVCIKPFGDGAITYINDQSSAAVGGKRLGVSTVAHGGCGVVATYNAEVTLGNRTTFDEVLAYYNDGSGKLNLGGLAGIMPNVVADYFKNKGYSVIMTDDRDGIDIYSQTADASILWYLFTDPSSILGYEVDLFGGHFIEYTRTETEYLGHNTAETAYDYSISIASDYAYKDSRFYAVGIFIYKK